MTTTDVRSSAVEALAGRIHTDAQILPIEHPVWCFYRLVP